MLNENNINPAYELDFDKTSDQFLGYLKPIFSEYLEQVFGSIEGIRINDINEFLNSLTTQSRAADLLNTSQPFISNLISKGKINTYTQANLVCVHEVEYYLNNSKWHRGRKKSKESWIKLIWNNPLPNLLREQRSKEGDQQT